MPTAVISATATDGFGRNGPASVHAIPGRRAVNEPGGRLVELSRDGVPRHVVISLLNGMGDAVLALPLIRYVIDRFGRDRVSVWANQYHGKTVYAELGDVLVGTSECNLNIAAERKEEELAALRRCLPAGRVLSWVSLNSYEPRTVVEDYAIHHLKPQSLWQFRGAHVRFDPQTGRVLHRMDQYFRVIGESRTPPVERRPLLDDAVRRRAMAIRDHVHRMAKQLIVVHAQTESRKRWPQSHWRALGRLLQEHCALVVLGLPDTALSWSDPYLSMPPDWQKQIAIMAYADAFVGVDSCFSHVADAFGLDGVVLYGDAAAAAAWQPKGPALKPLIAENGRLETISAADVADQITSCLRLRTRVEKAQAC
jgi:hypothetical protein